MKADIITIGDELLIGQVVDTNSAWIGQELSKAGISVHRITSISDKEDEILAVLKETTERSPIVLISGGLGPTKDDITKAALCRFFNTKLVFNSEVYSDVETFLKGRVHSINELNRTQAMVPESCTVIRNMVGTAPIMWFSTPKGVLVSMPGVPSEMKHAMSTEVLPRLIKAFPTEALIHRTIHVFDIPESILAEHISEWEESLPDCIRLAYLPSPGKIRLRLSAKGSERKQLEEAVDKAIDQLYPLIGDNIFGFDDQKPEEELIRLLKAKSATIACAESCSGGYLSHLFTSIPGASEVFNGSVVAYSNSVKAGVLGVDTGLIEQHGAVSREVVEAMAQGAIRITGSDYAISTSGIAGPTGGSDEKPVGTVWIAWASKDKVLSRRFLFGKGRERVIMRTADAGVIVMKQLLEKGEL